MIITINQRISTLRTAMKNHGLDAYIVPSNDPHQSEYVANRWKSRKWISGFTGSAGTIIVTHHAAGLWTDSRYFLQGGQELSDTEILLHRPRDRYAPEYINWLSDNLPNGSEVGIDGNLCTIGQYNKYSKTLDRSGVTLNTRMDLFDEIWSDREDIPDNKIYELDTKYAGEKRENDFIEYNKSLEKFNEKFLLSAKKLVE